MFYEILIQLHVIASTIIVGNIIMNRSDESDMLNLQINIWFQGLAHRVCHKRTLFVLDFISGFVYNLHANGLKL